MASVVLVSERTSPALIDRTPATTTSYGGDGYFASSSAAVLHRVDRVTTTIDIRPTQPVAAAEHLVLHRSTWLFTGAPEPTDVSSLPSSTLHSILAIADLPSSTASNCG